MKIAVVVPLLATLAAFTSPIALAQEAPGPGKACRADRQKFCAGIKPGDGKLAACMKEHEAELSPECTAARQAARDSGRIIRASCKADAQKFCADVEKGQGRMLQCLESHAAELQQACAEALKSRPGAKQG